MKFDIQEDFFYQSEFSYSEIFPSLTVKNPTPTDKIEVECTKLTQSRSDHGGNNLTFLVCSHSAPCTESAA